MVGKCHQGSCGVFKRESLNSGDSTVPTTDRLIMIETAAELLGCSVKSVRRYLADTRPDRIFPQPTWLPSPSGTRPLLRLRESEVRRFAGLEQE